MRLYKTNKSVLAFKNNPVPFLNGITSNTIDATHNAFLNIHGKIIATFDQLKISDDEMWICLESEFVESVLEHTMKFSRLAKVDTQKMEKVVYFDLDGDATLSPDDRTIAQKKGRLIISTHAKICHVSDEDFTRFRLENAIALQGVDYKNDFILNISDGEFVSFTKGCYLGQEPVSKVHNRSKPTWRLVVKKMSDCTEEERQQLTSLSDQGKEDKALGFIFEKNP